MTCARRDLGLGGGWARGACGARAARRAWSTAHSQLPWGSRRCQAASQWLQADRESPASQTYKICVDRGPTVCPAGTDTSSSS